jgi:hypothetical protein
MEGETVLIERRFHGPRNSANGGYACGRLANFIEGTATVRLLIPPPLDVELEVRRTEAEVRLVHDGETIASGWPARLELDVPEPPTMEEASQAALRFRGFETHRFPSCFVCGRDRRPGEGLRIFAGPVEGREMVACTWTPEKELVGVGDWVRPEFLWAVLDCPGGFAFPEPSEGTILLGQLTVAVKQPAGISQRYTIIGWEISREGRKHHTGTALFSDAGICHAVAKGIWFEVDQSPDQEIRNLN